MSPNEAQLRAALQEGEGDRLDAGALIAHAVGVRQQRRRRVYLAAGAAAAVAAVGVGIAALTNTAGHDNSNAAGSVTAPANAARAPRALAPETHAGAAGAASTPGYGSMNPAHLDQRAAMACPQRAPRSLLPGGGGSGQFGASQPLFTHKVAKIVVCAYPAKASASPRRLVVRGGDATGLASALESAATAYHASPCPATRAALPGTLELLAADANGVRSRPVLITVGCPTTMATNGTAVRYPDSLPRRFLKLLRTDSAASPVR